jgi:hypothetical protein
MKRVMIGLVLLWVIALVPLGAADRPMALAMSIGQRGGDFSLGAEVLAPTLFDGLVALYGGVDLQYKAGRAQGGDQEWYPYVLASVGLQITATQTDWLRLYASSALLVFVPSPEVGSLWHMGGYGGFGVEFFFASEGGGSYYIEIGGTGTAAKAIALAHKPYLGNGLTIKAGCRFLLC